MRINFLSRSYQAGIDLGSSQLSCWLGQSNDAQELTLLGSGQMASRGLWGGQVTEVKALEESILRILYDAEQQSRLQVRQATIALNASFFTFDRCVLKAPLPHGVVTEGDIRQMISLFRRSQDHCTQIIPLEFRVDQQENIKDPRGIIGSHLTGHFHSTWMNLGRYQTIISCLKRCQVHVKDIIFSGYGSALCCLSPDERELGTMLMDWGASTTSASFFVKGLFVDQITLPVGGYAITKDIAKAFETSMAQAERLKILHGAALVTQNDHHETIPVPPGEQWGNEFTNPIPKAALIRLVQIHCEEVLAALKKKVEASPYAGSIQRIVLTGGAAQLPGLRELVQRFLHRSVRLARPMAPENAPRHSTDLSGVIGAMMHNGSPPDTLLTPPKKDFHFFSWLRKKM